MLKNCAGPNHGGLRAEEVSVFEMFWVLMVQGEDLRVGTWVWSTLYMGVVILYLTLYHKPRLHDAFNPG